MLFSKKKSNTVSKPSIQIQTVPFNNPYKNQNSSVATINHIIKKRCSSCN